MGGAAFAVAAGPALDGTPPRGSVPGVADDLRTEVVIEVPRGGRNKYEWDDERAVVVFERRIVGAVAFPADYGFVPGTRTVDGDPLDAVVLLDEPTYPGVHVPVRVLGALLVVAGEDPPEAKLICAATGDPTYALAYRLEDLPEHLVDTLEQFFAVYKQLGEGRPLRVTGRLDVAQARRLLEESVRPA